MRARSFLVVVFVAACGEASGPAATLSGTDLSCGPNMFIVAGSCRPLPPIGSDASAAVDSDADSVTEGATSSADPLAPCALAAQDVFFVDLEVDAGPFVNGPQIHTNAEATFFAQAAPGTIEVLISTGQGPAGSLRIWIRNAGSLRPGIFPQGPAATGPSLELVLRGEGVPIRSGSLTVYDFQATTINAGTTDLRSMIMSFDLNRGPSEAGSIKGCLVYRKDLAASAPWVGAGDAAPVPSVGASDAAPDM